jgi:capsular polysaccharide biosynthesis protein
MNMTSFDWDEGPSVLASAWRYKWLLALGMLLGAAAGYMLSAVQPTRYEGVSRVLLPEPMVARESSSQPAVDPNRNLLNQVAIMTSTPVLKRAAARYGNGITVDDVRGRVIVDGSQESDVITIRALDPTAAGAARLADAVMRSYDEVVSDQAQSGTNADIRRIKSQEVQLLSRLNSIVAARTIRPNDPGLQIQFEAISSQLRDVTTQEVQLTTQVRQSVGTVGLREEADVPEEPAQPKPLRTIAAGALFCLIASTALAWWLNSRRGAADAGQPHLATGQAGQERESPAGTTAPTSNGVRHPPGPDRSEPAVTRPSQEEAGHEATFVADEPHAARATNGMKGKNSFKPKVVSPLVHRPAREDDVDLSQVQETGPQQRVRRPGVEAFVKQRHGAPAEDGSRMMLTPESVADYEQLTTSIRKVTEALGGERPSLYDQSLPQIEVEEMADRFDLDVVAILLDNGEGLLKVAGGVGLSVVERRATVDYDRDLMTEVFEAGPRLVDKDDRAQLVKAGIPGSRAEPLVLVPLVHEQLGFGVLLAGRQAVGDGDQPSLTGQDIEDVIAFTRVTAPSLHAWVLLRQLRAQLLDVQ